MSLEPTHPEIWRALADPSRRRVLDLLRDGPRTTGSIAAEFDISRIAVMRHLAVLAESGLVVSRKRGRERWHYINAVPLVGIQQRWVEPLQAGWARMLLRLGDHVGGRRPDVGSEGSTLSLDIAQHLVFRADRPAVWRALTEEISAWWGAPYLTDRATGLRIDPGLGGTLQEDWGPEGGKALATVTAIEPGRSLELTGPFHLGVVYGIATFLLEDASHGTELHFAHRAIGAVDAEVAEAFAGGWADLLDTRLRAFVERTGSPAEGRREG